MPSGAEFRPSSLQRTATHECECRRCEQGHRSSCQSLSTMRPCYKLFKQLLRVEPITSVHACPGGRVWELRNNSDSATRMGKNVDLSKSSVAVLLWNRSSSKSNAWLLQVPRFSFREKPARAKN